MQRAQNQKGTKPYALFRNYAADGGAYVLSSSSQSYALLERALKLEDSIVDAQSAVSGRLNLEVAGPAIHCCMLRSLQPVRTIIGMSGDGAPTVDELLLRMCESNDSFLVMAAMIAESRLPMFRALLRMCEPKPGMSVVMARRDEKGNRVCLSPDDFLVAISMTPFDPSAWTKPPAVSLAQG